MTCASCGRRNARRACPALGADICTVCCATKREVEIRCTPGCRYLTAGREHPAAAVVRQRETDLAHLVAATRDYSDRQTQLFLAVNQAIAAFPGTGLQPLVDGDVAQAAAALAQTLESASKGVIYEQRPASVAAGRLVDLLRPALSQVARTGGSAFERDAAVVFRDIERLASTLAAGPGATEYLSMVRRTIGAPSAGSAAPVETPRLILP